MSLCLDLRPVRIVTGRINICKVREAFTTISSYMNCITAAFRITNLFPQFQLEQTDHRKIPFPPYIATIRAWPGVKSALAYKIHHVEDKT